MPAAVLMLLGLSMGALLGRGAPAERAASRRSLPGGLDDGTAIVALLGALVHGPVCAYFLVFAGDWSFAYFVDARAVPSALVLLAVVADAALVVIGYRLARARPGSLGALAWLVAAPVIAALTSVVILLPRVRMAATYDEHRLGFGHSALTGSPLGWAVVWMGLMLALGTWIAHRALRGGAGIRGVLAPLARRKVASADGDRRLGRS